MELKDGLLTIIIIIIMMMIILDGIERSYTQLSYRFAKPDNP